ncbi:translation initiation factor IF-2, partial [bacterium]|nr:translation initiation factor IF-2 [bacterium]
MRVYELAREFGIPSKLLIARMRSLGIEVAGHMSSVDPKQEKLLRTKLEASAKTETSFDVPLRQSKGVRRPPTAEEKASARAASVGTRHTGKPRVRVRHHPKVEETKGEVKPVEEGAEKLPAEVADEVFIAPKVHLKGTARPKPEKPTLPVSSQAAVEVGVEPPVVPPPSKRDIKRPDFEAQAEEKAEEKRGGSRVLFRPEKPVSAEELGLAESAKRRAKGTRRRRRRRRKSSSVMIHELRTSRKTRSKPKEEAKKVAVSRPMTPVELADLLHVPVDGILEKLLEWGEEYGTIEEMDVVTVATMVDELGFEAVLPSNFDDESRLKPRPPIVAVLGHVDHGKTTLLDYIRKTNVAAGEAGGITQHIGAYQVKTDHGLITFIDTPGHEAFTAMRARGAEVTDIVVLVVAADDGVMPQTVEAINHARAADVEIVVAITKIDKPEADTDRVRRQLSKYNLAPEDWGGETTFCEVSGITGDGVDHLLEILVIHGEMLELKADGDASPQGVLIETRIDRGRGSVGTVIITDGTLKQGQTFVCGTQAGKVRLMTDDMGKQVEAISPGTPGETQGFYGLPEAGDSLVVVSDEKTARNIAALRQSAGREEKLESAKRKSLADFLKPGGAQEPQKLPLIVKGDVNGTVEAVRDSLTRFNSEEVEVEVVHSAVGGVTEADVQLAAASEAIIVGFNVRPDAKANNLAQRVGVQIRIFKIIYELLDEIKAVVSGMLAPEILEQDLGQAEVRETFRIPRVGVIAGCYIVSGKVKRNVMARLVRDGRLIYEGRLSSLRRFKEDVREVTEGYECGI